MRVDPIKLERKSQLIEDYRAGKNEIMKYFDYSPYHHYEQRVSDLKEREFNREQLVNVLSHINEEWDAPNATYNNIERLKDNKSVVVIGGQQAGLLTGPLYTVNKIISIIQFAKQQESNLNIPVIPVFWIAGEDHDYDEINHIFLSSPTKPEKYKISQQVHDKQSLSHLHIDKEMSDEWLNEIFKQLEETEYTKDLYTNITACLNESKTYVDFFAKLIYKLFPEEGVVLIDSAHPDVREIESDYFIDLIENQPDIATKVTRTYQQLQREGYLISLDIKQEDAHLFFHKNNERILLMRNDNGDWLGKNNEMKLTTDEMIRTAKEHPELLSNNVITRPLMQEMLFPTLSFIGGDGEVSYWAVLKSAFHSLNIKMPPVLPRLSITYIDQNIEKALNKFSIPSDYVINKGVEELQGNWLASQSDPPIGIMFDQFKNAVNDAHRPLRNIAQEIRSDLGDLANKNLEYIFQEITFLEDRMNKIVEEKYANQISEFTLINNTLHPNQTLQERIWNPLPLINEHGLDFLKTITNESWSFEEEHHVVYL